MRRFAGFATTSTIKKNQTIKTRYILRYSNHETQKSVGKHFTRILFYALEPFLPANVDVSWGWPEVIRGNK